MIIDSLEYMYEVQFVYNIRSTHDFPVLWFVFAIDVLVGFLQVFQRYSSELLHWHRGHGNIADIKSYKSIDYINKTLITKQNTPKPCSY